MPQHLPGQSGHRASKKVIKSPATMKKVSVGTGIMGSSPSGLTMTRNGKLVTGTVRG